MSHLSDALSDSTSQLLSNSTFATVATAEEDAGAETALPREAGAETWVTWVTSEETANEESRDSGAMLSSSGDAGVDGGGDAASLPPRSGFIDIEPVSYVRHGEPVTASSARLFYSFHPADVGSVDAPTFVFFNGGPGYATSLGLMSFGTGPMTLQLPEQGGQLVPNPWSWTQLGNLLYIDTRQAGFSYSTLGDSADSQARAAENHARNFNDYIDAADILRVILRVLKGDEALQDNPVVLVGESYGGVRASLVLKYALDWADLRDDWWYADEGLADELEAHFSELEARIGLTDPTDQFQAQILIQPFVAHTQFDDQSDIWCVPGSKEAQIAEAGGFPCQSLRYYRDPYQMDEAPEWSAGLDVLAGQHLMNPPSLESLLQVDLGSIAGLAATEREGAFRASLDYPTLASTAFIERFGVIPAWDTYHVALAMVTRNDDLYDNPYPCFFFSRVAASVDTFVTNGELDGVVRTQVLPTTLLACQALSSAPFVEDIQVTTDPQSNQARPGQWTITYTEDSPYGAGERVVRWPTYAESGHMVATRQPQELFEDVREFLVERRIIP